MPSKHLWLVLLTLDWFVQLQLDQLVLSVAEQMGTVAACVDSLAAWWTLHHSTLNIEEEEDKTGISACCTQSLYALTLHLF